MKNLLLEKDSRIKWLEKKLAEIFNRYFGDIFTRTSRYAGSDYWLDDNPDTLWVDYLKFHFLHEFELLDNRSMKFIPDTARIAYDELDFDVSDANTVQFGILGDIINVIKNHDAQNPSDLWFEKHFKGLTFEELLEFYKPILDKAEQDDIDKTNNYQETERISDYTIIKNIQFNQAKQIGSKSGENGCSIICYTNNHSTWNGYTENGRNTCYCLLRNDWETVPCEHTEQLLDHGPRATAYDSYGLSMIFVFVSPEGKITNSNTRWNHRANYGDRRLDKAMTMYDLTTLLNKKFTDVINDKQVSYGEVSETKKPMTLLENYNNLLNRMG